jgi:hypothetical protein
MILMKFEPAMPLPPAGAAAVLVPGEPA